MMRRKDKLRRDIGTKGTRVEKLVEDHNTIKAMIEFVEGM
jgi:hypothetical protein